MLGMNQMMGPIGLDLGTQRVKAVQLCRSKGKWVAHAAACFNRLEPDQPLTKREAKRIREVLTRRGFNGTGLAIAVPTDGLIEAVLDVPPSGSNAPREQIVRIELARQHRISPDSVEVAYWSLPPNAHAGQREQVVAVGYPHAQAQMLVSPLEAVGLVVNGIEPATTALARLGRPLLQRDDHIGAVLDLGASGFRLTLVLAGRVVHHRVLPFAGTRAMSQLLVDHVGGDGVLADAALKHYGVSGSQGYDLGSLLQAEIEPVLAELIEQIGMSFAYVSHQYPAAELGPLLLTGGGARMPGLLSEMGQTLGIAVFTAVPSAVVDAGDWLAEDLDRPEAALAAGLAMTGGGA